MYQYNLDGILANTFTSLENAANTVDTVKQTICKAALSETNYYKGYFWSYDYIEPFKPSKKMKTKKVYQLNILEEHVSEFNSVAEASKLTRINKTSIAKVCRGERAKAGGYK